MKKIIVLLIAMTAAPGAMAQSSNWQKTWDETLAVAKKEGKVTDGTKWKRGKPYFADPDEQYVLMLFSRLDGLLFINTAEVKPEEIRAAKDLVNPKWKGKIATEDPNASGSGSNSSVHYYSQLG